MIGLLTTGALLLVALAVVAMAALVRPSRCDVPGCRDVGRWQARDGGPGALCDLHADVDGHHRPRHLTKGRRR